MISEFFINIIFGLVEGMFTLLPDVTWSVKTTFFDYLISFIRMAGYLLPWGTVTTICGLIVALSIFRIIISIVKTIWDLLPLV